MGPELLISVIYYTASKTDKWKFVINFHYEESQSRRKRKGTEERRDGGRGTGRTKEEERIGVERGNRKRIWRW